MSIAEKLTTIAENEQKVYDAGKKAERDNFWYLYQNKGQRTDYTRAFYMWQYPSNLFYPRYDIKNNCQEAFRGWYGTGISIDLAERLDECGVTLDTSKTNFVQFATASSKITRFPALDASSATSFQSAFQGCIGLIAIDRIITHEGVTTYSNAFYNCTSLENVTFEGTIAVGLSFSSCTKLTHDSLMSIINALKEFADGTTKTLTLGADNLAKLTDTEKAIATEKGWTLA